MAANVLLPLLIPLGEQLANVTQLIGRSPVKFSEAFYDISIQEDASLGPLLRLKVITKPPNEPVRFKLVGGSNFLTNTTRAVKGRKLGIYNQGVGVGENRSKEDGGKWFKLHEETGVLELVQPLDYELYMQHNLRIRALGSLGSAETQVRVVVSDANDHKPVFLRPSHQTQITEEDDRHLPKPLLQVEAEDWDAGKWGEIRYSISGDGIPHYERKHKNKEHHLTRHKKRKKPSTTPSPFLPDFPDDDKLLDYLPSLDYKDYLGSLEKYAALDLDEWLRTANSSFLNSSSKFNNDQDNRINQTPLVQGFRNTRDVDLSPRSQTKYTNNFSNYINSSDVGKENNRKTSINSKVQPSSRSKSSVKLSPAFSVDGINGTVFVMMPLDRDGEQGRTKWRLTVTASDGQYSATCQVLVNLKDVNDNPPVFSESIIRAFVNENAPIGTKIAQVSALDPDDELEGRNAQLVYSLQKNVIDENSGKPIFSVDSFSGVIRTDLCCLDREHTSRYILQLAATDGGGLKGTCAVLVEVQDVNDVPPRWTNTEWTFDVEESLDPSTVLATLTVVDPDSTNHLAYRVVPGSGRGWKLVHLTPRSDGSGAELSSLQPLDYEDRDQRRGLKFQVQVTDQGPDDWSNQYRQSIAYVIINILDINDNKPEFFSGDHVTVSIPEDSAVGTKVAALTATDADAGPSSVISYSISLESNPENVFEIQSDGQVNLVRTLDREHDPEHHLRVIAWDSGHPRQSSSTTLTVKVADVNDNPPYLLSPRTVSVPTSRTSRKSPLEGHSSVTFNITLTDLDDWQAGNGPPFTLLWNKETTPKQTSNTLITVERFVFAKAVINSEENIVTIRTTCEISFNAMDHGGSTSTNIIVRDSGSPAKSSTVSITFNREHHGYQTSTSKKIQVYLMQRFSGSLRIGQVSQGLKYEWLKAHPFFDLDKRHGVVTLTQNYRPGTYRLQVLTTNSERQESKIDLSISLEQISPKLAFQSVPIEVSVSAKSLLSPKENGRSVLDDILHFVHLKLPRNIHSSSPSKNIIQARGVRLISIEELESSMEAAPTTRIWIMVDYPSESIELLLQRYKHELEEAIGVSLLGSGLTTLGRCNRQAQECPCCCQDKISISGNYSLVDISSSAHLGPRLILDSICGCHKLNTDNKKLRESEGTFESENTESSDYVPSAHAVLSEVVPTCQANTCLNGGRCFMDSENKPRCICPEGTEGRSCKHLSRQFVLDKIGRKSNSSWVWLPPLPTCTKLHMSIYILTSSSNGQILFVASKQTGPYEPYLSLTLNNGHPQAKVRTSTTGPTATITLNATVADNVWHRLDVVWINQTLALYLDLCSSSGLEPHGLLHRSFRIPDVESQNKFNFSNCRQSTQLPIPFRAVGLISPMQLGFKPSTSEKEKADNQNINANSSFIGCVSHVRINKKLQDLGTSVVGEGSYPGCKHLKCQRYKSLCPQNSKCVGSREGCSCILGFSGTDCSIRTSPSTLQLNSFVHIALSFSPQPYSNDIQLRIRTRQLSGLVMALSSRQGKDSFMLSLHGGMPCLDFRNPPNNPLKLCLQTAVNDGSWHAIRALRYGSFMELIMDEGDGSEQYTSVLMLQDSSSSTPDPVSPALPHPQLLHVHRQEGVSIGGIPEFHGPSATTVHSDLRNTCLDDVRLDGHPLPLPPNTKATPWGAVTFEQGVTGGCETPDACLNVTCTHPLQCKDSWYRHYCSCPDGLTISADQSKCIDVDECSWSPCLNRGKCINRETDYKCVCLPSYSGNNCESSLSVRGNPLPQHITWLTVICSITGVVASMDKRYGTRKKPLKLDLLSEVRKKNTRPDFLRVTQCGAKVLVTLLLIFLQYRRRRNAKDIAGKGCYSNATSTDIISTNIRTSPERDAGEVFESESCVYHCDSQAVLDMKSLTSDMPKYATISSDRKIPVRNMNESLISRCSSSDLDLGTFTDWKGGGRPTINITELDVMQLPAPRPPSKTRKITKIEDNVHNVKERDKNMSPNKKKNKILDDRKLMKGNEVTCAPPKNFQ